jgi:undecaprenyl-diphosphatase
MNLFIMEGSLGGTERRRIPIEWRSLKLSVVVALFCAAVLALTGFDDAVYHWVERCQTPPLRSLFAGIAFYGRFPFAFSLCLLLYGVGCLTNSARCKRAASRTLMAVVLSGVLVLLAKPLFGRKERFTAHNDHSHDTWLQHRWGRFPSGDSATAWATSTALALEFPVIAVPAYTIATLTALGRVYRHMHLLSDVMAGGGLGFIFPWSLAWQARKKNCIEP